MAIVTSRTSLNQGTSTAVSDVTFATGVGADIGIDSTGNELPALAVGEFFEIREHSNSQNNGLYKIVTVNTSTTSYEADKVNGSAPVTNAVPEAITTLGATGAALEKSVFFDTAGLGAYILEQGNVSSDGVTGQAIYSFSMQEWKDDNFLIANAPFPLLTIDADAGKFLIGQNASGNNSGWNWVDDWAGFAIRTRKLLRNMGWDEIDSQGNTIAREVGIVTLGVFEDSANDTAYYSFGTDTTVDNTVDFDFAGPVNESVRFFEEVGNPDTFTYVDGAGGDDSVTRATGSFITDGFVVGGRMTTRNSTTSANDGTYTILTVAALTMTFATASFDTGEADSAAIVAIDNTNAITLGLRVRDADANGKTFAQATLATAGKTILGNFVYSFPLANATDLKITATDVGIDANSDGAADVAPYSGMSITYHSSGQSRSNLVGGPYNFSIIIDGNNGTAQEIYEFIQWSLRSTGGFGTGDIDADADIAIGRAMDLLCRFNGEILELGSADGGLNFPYNPDTQADGGVYCDNIHSSSANNVQFYDDTGVKRTAPETISVTLDFNSTAIDDVTTEFDLFYDRTIRTTVADLVITSGTDTFTSAGANLPATGDVGDYVRISGLTGADEPMNGVYQVLVETSTSSWDVIRYDGQAIVTTTSASVSLDENCVDTPDAIIVHTNVVNTESGSTITYTAPDTIGDTANGFALTSGDRIEIEGSTSNDGIYTVDTAAAGSITLIEQTITTEASSSSSVISQIVSGLASTDYSFSYDFDGNVQGGRTVSTDTFVQAKAIGSTTSQYTESTVQTIESGTPLTIPVVAQIERNYA